MKNSLNLQTPLSIPSNTSWFNLLNMNTNECIRNRMTQLGLKQRDLVERTGASRGTVSIWINGPSSPEGEYLLKLARALQTTPDWLISGKGAADQPSQSEPKNVIPVTVWDTPEDLDPSKYVIIPRVCVRFSAGAGREISFEPDMHDKGNAYRLDWIRSKGLDPQRLIVVIVDGESMAPTLPNGSAMTTDTRKNTLDHVVDGGVYAIRYGNELRVKRLRRRFDGALIIDSDNPAFAREIVEPHQLEHIGIIGGYVAHSCDGPI